MNTHTTNLPAIETHTFPNSHIISCLNLNLAQIAASGQCFRMLPVPEKPGIWSLISVASYKSAELEYTKAVENYEWAVKGLIVTN